MGNLHPFILFQLCFQPRMPTKQLECGVMSVVKGLGTGRVDMWSGLPPILKDSNSRLHLDGEMAFQRDKCVAKVVPNVQLVGFLNVSTHQYDPLSL